jgi:hypothetical protein
LSAPVSRSDALRAVRGNPQSKDADKQEALDNATAITTAIEAKGREDFFQLRIKWSNWIIGWITSLILFNCALAFFVGLGRLNFQDYKWFITAVTVETFLQIVGMGYIAVRFLFSHSESTHFPRKRATEKATRPLEDRSDDS